MTTTTTTTTTQAYNPVALLPRDEPREGDPRLLLTVPPTFVLSLLSKIFPSDWFTLSKVNRELRNRFNHYFEQFLLQVEQWQAPRMQQIFRDSLYASPGCSGLSHIAIGHRFLSTQLKLHSERDQSSLCVYQITQLMLQDNPQDILLNLYLVNSKLCRAYSRPNLIPMLLMHALPTILSTGTQNFEIFKTLLEDASCLDFPEISNIISHLQELYTCLNKNGIPIDQMMERAFREFCSRGHFNLSEHSHKLARIESILNLLAKCLSISPNTASLLGNFDQSLQDLIGILKATPQISLMDQIKLIDSNFQAFVNDAETQALAVELSSEIRNNCFLVATRCFAPFIVNFLQKQHITCPNLLSLSQQFQKIHLLNPYDGFHHQSSSIDGLLDDLSLTILHPRDEQETNGLKSLTELLIEIEKALEEDGFIDLLTDILPTSYSTFDEFATELKHRVAQHPQSLKLFSNFTSRISSAWHKFKLANEEETAAYLKNLIGPFIAFTLLLPNLEIPFEEKTSFFRNGMFQHALTPAESLHIKTLDLSSCRFSSIPPQVANAHNMEVLDLSYNDELTALPSFLANLSHLKKVNTRNCPKLKIVPKVLLNAQNPAIKDVARRVLRANTFLGRRINDFKDDYEYYPKLTTLNIVLYGMIITLLMGITIQTLYSWRRN